MSDDSIKIKPSADTSAKAIDCEKIGSGSAAVDRQRAQIGGAALAEIARVSNAPLTSSDYGLGVRPVPAPLAVAFSHALETNHVIKGGPGTLRMVAGRLDSTAPTGSYYVLVIDATVLPPDGAVTLLLPPGKIEHTTGFSDPFAFDDVLPRDGTTAAAGVVVALSTTEFTLTIAGAFMSVSGS